MFQEIIFSDKVICDTFGQLSWATRFSFNIFFFICNIYSFVSVNTNRTRMPMHIPAVHTITTKMAVSLLFSFFFHFHFNTKNFFGQKVHFTRRYYLIQFPKRPLTSSSSSLKSTDVCTNSLEPAILLFSITEFYVL